MQHYRRLFILFTTIHLIAGCKQINRIDNTEPPALRNGDPLFIQAEDAVTTGDYQRLKQLLKQYPYLANARNSRRVNGQTTPRSLLHILSEPPAHRKNRLKTARLIVDSGCDVNGRLYYNHGETSLHWAAQSGDIELIKTLISLGAAVDATGSHIDNGTPLVNAIHYGQTKAAQTLVEQGASVFSFPLSAGLGRKDLMLKFIANGQLKPQAANSNPNAAVPAALDHTAIQNIYQRAFSYAVFNHQFVIADDLLKTGVDINHQWGEANYTLLHRIAQRGSQEMALYLLREGAAVNIATTADNATPLQVAARHNNTRVELVLQKYGGN